MADVRILKIDTSEAVQNIKDLKDNISAYKERLSTLTIGTEEYQNTLKELSANQYALREAMHGTAASFDEVMGAAKGTNVVFDENNNLVKSETVSYNELVRELSLLKEQWRSTTDAAERAQLGERINAVNDRLKTMDASVGVFGRNVGNYIGAVDHLTAGLTSMGGGATKLINPIKGVTAGFKTLSSTPAVAVMGLFASLLMKVIDGLGSAEDNTNKMSQALAPLKAIGDAVTKVMQALGSAVVWVAEKFGALTAAIFGNNDAMKERQALAEKEAQLAAQERESIVKNAQAEKDIAELRAKAADKTKYTATERIDFLKKAGDLESEISKRALRDAKLQYQIIHDKNQLSKSSAEDKKKEAEAYAAMLNAETAYYNQMRSINKQISAARTQEAKEAKDAAKAVRDAAKAKITAEKDYLASVLAITESGSYEQLKLQNAVAAKERDLAKADAKQKITDKKTLARTLAVIDKQYELKVEKNKEDHVKTLYDLNLKELTNRRDALRQGSIEYAEANEQLAAEALAGLTKGMNESEQAFNARVLAAEKNLTKAQNELRDAVAKSTEEGLQEQIAAVRKGSVEQLSLSLELAKSKLDNLYQGMDESAEAFATRRLEAEREVRNAEDALAEGEIERDHVILEQRLASLQQGSAEYLEAELELKQYELDTLHQMEGESNEAFRLREVQAEKAAADAKKAIWENNLQMMQQVAGGVSSLMSGLADMFETNGDNDKKAQKRAKNLRIAGATIDMLAGAVTAYTTAQKLGPPQGPIVGAINAAAVVAAGAANIAKIRQTQISDTSSSTTDATVPAPVTTPRITEVRTLTTDSEEERLNKMAADQRVYILDSDIQAKNDQRKVEVAETTF